MPLITVLVPSNRPRMLTSFLRILERNAGTEDYEVVVVSPFPVEEPRVRWIPETEKNGIIAACRQAHEAAQGEYLVGFPDYLQVKPNALANMVRFMQAWERRVMPFLGGFLYIEYPQPGTQQWLQFLGPRVGTVFGHYYPYFSAVSRRTLEIVGDFFQGGYQAGGCDPDLALRVWQAGGQCQLCWDAAVVSSVDRLLGVENSNPTNTGKPHHNHDMILFLRRWYQIYGKGWGINFRQWNIDIPAVMLEDDDMSLLPGMVVPPASENGFALRRKDGTIVTFPRISF